MSGKKKASSTTDLKTLKIGGRVRCRDGGVEGRINWANGVAVKTEWADGAKVTWKRADLPDKGLEVFAEAAYEPQVDPAPTAPALPAAEALWPWGWRRQRPRRTASRTTRRRRWRGGTTIN
jgi:hypothetical protein